MKGSNTIRMRQRNLYGDVVAVTPAPKLTLVEEANYVWRRVQRLKKQHKSFLSYDCWERRYWKLYKRMTITEMQTINGMHLKEFGSFY